MNRLWILSGWLSVLIISKGLIQTPPIPNAAEVCTDEDYAIFSAALDGFPVFRKADSWIILDHTTNGYPPGLAATARVRSVEAFYKDVPEARDDLDARNKNRVQIDVSKIKAPFETLSLSGEEAETLVLREGGWEAFHQKYPKTRGFVVISRPGLNRERNRALLYVGDSCGPLCGGGTFLLLIKETGKWKVINTVTVWLS